MGRCFERLWYKIVVGWRYAENYDCIGVSADAGVVCGSICGSRGGSVRDVVHGQRVGGWMLGCRVLTRRVAVV